MVYQPPATAPGNRLQLPADVDGLLRVLLPPAAGNFIYLAGSILLPELVAETETRRSTVQPARFLGGIAAMGGLPVVESLG